MAELTEKAEWTDGIYQLETSDPVVGGPGGISNRQAQELAYRTRYLKDNLDATSAGLSQHESAADPHTQYAPKLNPTFSGMPKAPTPASDSNSDQLATTAFVKSVVAPKAPLNSPALSGIPTAPTADESVNTTQIATTAFVKSAINALVDGSPAALDTLKELSAALGNDANFAATVTNSLSGKMEKGQNGADIPDKARFLENLGFRDNVQKEIARTRGLHKFLTSGQFVVPEGVSTLYLSGCGGGGGGGGGGCRTLTYEWGGGGGGGGAGQPVIKEAVNVTPGEVIAVTIGAAGSAGITRAADDGTPGSGGGATTFGNYLTLAGGGGGDPGGGSDRQYGGAGGFGYPSGSFGNDGVGSSPVIASGSGGAGASGPFGGGGGMVRSSAAGSAYGVMGCKGYGYGAGGGGGSTGTPGKGAEGQPGMLIVEW